MRLFLKYCLFISIAFIFSSCSDGGSEESTQPNYSSEFYGNYDVVACTSNNCRLTLTSTGTKVTTTDGETFNWNFSNKIESLENIGDGIYKTYFDNGNIFYLAKLDSTKVLSGKINAQSANLAPSRAIALGGIDVILSQFGKDDKTVTTTADGSFDFNNTENVPSTITVSDITVPISTMNDNETDTGVITLSNEVYNFKSELFVDRSLLYSQNQYSATIRVHNLSNTQVNGLNVVVTGGSNVTMSQAFSQRTINANEYIDVNFNYTLDYISTKSAKMVFDIEISESSANQWLDNLSYTFYKDSIFIDICNASSNKNIYATISNNTIGNIKYFGICTGITMPYLSGESYTIIIGNRDINRETAYFISYDVDLHLGGGAQILSSIHEPDNTPSQATSIAYGEVAEGYISLDDIDFYRIDMN